MFCLRIFWLVESFIIFLLSDAFNGKMRWRRSFPKEGEVCMEIARLNIRSTMPRIGIRTQLSKLETHFKKAELHGDYQAPRANAGWEQPTLEIDSYPSRHSYGYTNHEDFARVQGQKGLQDMRQGMSRRNSQAQDMVNNAARPGRNVVAEQAKQELFSRISQQRWLDVQAIPDPQMRFTPIKAHAEPDPGHYTTRIDAESMAKSDFNRGRVETYLRQKGDLRQWVTWGKYDTYA